MALQLRNVAESGETVRITRCRQRQPTHGPILRLSRQVAQPSVWLATFSYLIYEAGDSGLKEYEQRTAGRKNKKAASTEDPTAVVRTHSRVYFPSRETVLRSKGGKDVSSRCLRISPRHTPRLGALLCLTRSTLASRAQGPSAFRPSGGKQTPSRVTSSATAGQSGRASSCTAR